MADTKRLFRLRTKAFSEKHGCAVEVARRLFMDLERANKQSENPSNYDVYDIELLASILWRGLELFRPWVDNRQKIIESNCGFGPVAEMLLFIEKVNREERQEMILEVQQLARKTAAQEGLTPGEIKLWEAKVREECEVYKEREEDDTAGMLCTLMTIIMLDHPKGLRDFKVDCVRNLYGVNPADIDNSQKFIAAVQSWEERANFPGIRSLKDYLISVGLIKSETRQEETDSLSLPDELKPARPKKGPKTPDHVIAYIRGAGHSKTKEQVAREIFEELDFQISPRTVQAYRNKRNSSQKRDRGEKE